MIRLRHSLSLRLTQRTLLTQMVQVMLLLEVRIFDFVYVLFYLWSHSNVVLWVVQASCLGLSRRNLWISVSGQHITLLMSSSDEQVAPSQKSLTSNEERRKAFPSAWKPHNPHCLRLSDPHCFLCFLIGHLMSILFKASAYLYLPVGCLSVSILSSRGQQRTIQPRWKGFFVLDADN